MRRGDATFSECPIPYPTDRFRCRIIRVVDGDTYVVKVDRGWMDDSTVEIRLADIDTWERYSGTVEHRERGRLAYEYARDFAEGQWAMLHTQMDPDKYGRILGTFHIYDGSKLGGVMHDLSQALRENGYEKGAL